MLQGRQLEPLLLVLLRALGGHRRRPGERARPKHRLLCLSLALAAAATVRGRWRMSSWCRLVYVVIKRGWGPYRVSSSLEPVCGRFPGGERGELPTVGQGCLAREAVLVLWLLLLVDLILLR